MLTFRQKLFLSYLIAFCVFLALLFPFAAKAVRGVVNSSLSHRTSQVIERVISAPNEEVLISRLEAIGPTFFFRVSLLEPDGYTLYDSHTSTPRQPEDLARYLQEHPEITEAVERGTGYSESFSYSLNQQLVYVGKAFQFQGKTLVMRVAFPLSQVQELTDHFEFGFFTLGFVVLLLFGIMTSAIANHLSRPIQKIINAVRPYQEGRVDRLPEIDLGGAAKGRDEFGRLAETLNSLSHRITSQINSIKEEQSEKEAVLESLMEGVIAVDRNLVTTYANQTALDMLDQKSDTFIGHHFSIAGHPELKELLASCQQQGDMLAIDTQLGKAKKIYVDVIANPKGKDAGAVMVIQDKSIHYRILEMRKAFIANASHELKTPITIIRGFTEALHENPDMDQSIQHDVTQKIINNCIRMETLIKNLLRLADIEHLPRGNLRTIDLYPLLDHCREMTLATYPDAQIEIVRRSEEPITLVADPDLLEHAITNLTDNAAKYSKAPAQVRVSVALDPSDNMVEIAIADRGMGIPEEDWDHIFDRFYTVDKAHSRKLGGSGLGLSIVRTIVEKHFGKVRVKSKLGQGSTFTIRLPLNLDDA